MYIFIDFFYTAIYLSNLEQTVNFIITSHTKIIIIHIYSEEDYNINRIFFLCYWWWCYRLDQHRPVYNSSSEHSRARIYPLSPLDMSRDITHSMMLAPVCIQLNSHSRSRIPLLLLLHFRRSSVSRFCATPYDPFFFSRNTDGKTLRFQSTLKTRFSSRYSCASRLSRALSRRRNL